MEIYKIEAFSEWADETGISDENLLNAAKEMGEGLIDANLGGNVYKKRVALGNKGKSGGARTLLAFKVANKAFFMYGFPKNKRANINEKEAKALKIYAKELLGLTGKQIAEALRCGELIEVEVNEDE